MHAAGRIIDANANRAREALRVMEDAARFALDDAELAAGLKALRHGLRAALDRLPAGWLEAHRDVEGDVGTTISTPSERRRDGLADVVAAAGARLTEALRAIEETGKIIDPDLASAIESLRYRAYDLSTRLGRRLASGAGTPWRLCLLLTESMCRRPWADVVAAAVAAGADCIQVREKSMADAALLERIRAVIGVARPAGASVVVNDRPDLALAAGADGVHLGQDDLGVADVRRLAGRSLRVGVSTHDLDEADRAVRAGADVCGVGAMFASPTKPRDVSGPAYLAAFLERYPAVPHLAIGGITPDNVETLVAAGARGIAVSGIVCGADDPGSVTAALASALRPTVAG